MLCTRRSALRGCLRLATTSATLGTLFHTSTVLRHLLAPGGVLEAAPAQPPDWQQRRAWRAAIAIDPRTFVPFCLHWDDRQWHELLDRHRQLGLTHVYVQLRGRYPGQGDFDLRARLPFVEGRLRELQEQRFIPILWASAGEWHGDDADAVLEDWRYMLTSQPRLRSLLPIVVPGPEFDDYLTPANQHRLVEGFSRLFPDAYLALHFSPGVVDAAFVASHPSGRIHAVAYNMPREERDNRSRAAATLARVSKQVDTVSAEQDDADGSTAPMDCILGEFGAYDVLRGRRTFADGAALREMALSISGVSGVGD
ncbi:MAG: hypothetical protein AB7I50_24855 [Vicinamibacterales bacterium]